QSGYAPLYSMRDGKPAKNHNRVWLDTELSAFCQPHYLLIVGFAGVSTPTPQSIQVFLDGHQIGSATAFAIFKDLTSNNTTPAATAVAPATLVPSDGSAPVKFDHWESRELCPCVDPTLATCRFSFHGGVGEQEVRGYTCTATYRPHCGDGVV